MTMGNPIKKISGIAGKFQSLVSQLQLLKEACLAKIEKQKKELITAEARFSTKKDKVENVIKANESAIKDANNLENGLKRLLKGGK